MRILAVSVAPLFPDFVMGGSQRVLMEVAAGLGRAGHEVRVLCSQAQGNEAGFSPSPGVTVVPSLRLKGSFPAPFETLPHNLTATWEALRSESEQADRVYLHADAIYMRDVFGGRPVVRSLHDFIYEEALVSAFALPAALTIVPSDYLRRCIAASAGQVTDPGEIVVVPNGITVPSDLPKSVAPGGIAPRQPGDVILLHPHRLQPRKGLRESMLIAAEVQRRLPDRRVRLLVPAYQSGESLDEATDSLNEITTIAGETGATDALEPHSWLSPDAMASHYAFGDVTLCPGSFVESFGLVPVESVAAGTPAVCARAGALRDLDGIPGISHFDYGDISTAADLVMAALNDGLDSGAAREEVGARFSPAKMVEGYLRAITGPLPSTEPRSRERAESSAWDLAPWCHISGARIYHDYLARFERFPEIAKALSHSAGRIEKERLSHALASEVERAALDGFIVAV